MKKSLINIKNSGNTNSKYMSPGTNRILISPRNKYRRSKEVSKDYGDKVVSKEKSKTKSKNKNRVSHENSNHEKSRKK